MIILGIDPGYGRTGYGMICVEGANTRYVHAGCIETSASLLQEQRLEIIYNQLEHIIQQDQPDTLAIEKLFFAKNTKTAMRVAETRGIILLLGCKYSLPMREFAPTEVKVAVAGYGHADKKQVQDMVSRLLRITEMPKLDDAADALAIALTAAASRHAHVYPQKN